MLSGPLQTIHLFFFFFRAFLTAARSPQFLRIPLGSEWEPAWLRRANQPEHFAQRRAICLPCLAGAAPHIAEQSGSDCVLLRAAQQCPRPAGSAGGARGARTRSRSRTRSQHSAAQRPTIHLLCTTCAFMILVCIEALLEADEVEERQHEFRKHRPGPGH